MRSQFPVVRCLWGMPSVRKILSWFWDRDWAPVWQETWGNSLNPTLLLVKIQGILFASASQILFFFPGLHLTGYLTSPQVGTRRAGSGPCVMILGWNRHSPRGIQLAAAISAALGPGFSYQGSFFLHHLEISLLCREADKIHEKGPSVPNGPPLRTSCGPFSCPQVLGKPSCVHLHGFTGLSSFWS